ncbi:hypothetical protein TESG_08026 [Trichophyton tonsurans CBS 112818]|uniref:Uncharacterized protein n=1 Tax=Trichophyton tonsurans (strain CBS 112818) TaxID=647933 RepID=F2SAY2_TRIT1|nr:hypothetical protein TESG_08026 [Trichophyton tonsurans CBS 112818]
MRGKAQNKLELLYFFFFRRQREWSLHGRKGTRLLIQTTMAGKQASQRESKHGWDC